MIKSIQIYPAGNLILRLGPRCGRVPDLPLRALRELNTISKALAQAAMETRS